MPAAASQALIPEWGVESEVVRAGEAAQAAWGLTWGHGGSPVAEGAR